MVRDGKIELDYFKCAAWDDMIAEAKQLRPVYVHFPLVVGQGLGQAVNSETSQIADWQKIEDLLTQTPTPFVNVHLAPKVKDYPPIPADSTDPEHTELLVERVTRDVHAVVERFGADRVIIENDNSINGRLLRLASLAKVISRVIEETQCGFLLDVSHARLAANQLKENAE